MDFEVFCNFSNMKSNDFFTNNSSINQSLLIFKKKTMEYPCIFFYNLEKIFSKGVSTLVYFVKFLYKISREYPCYFSKSQSKEIILEIRVVSSSKGTVLSKV